MGRLSRNLGDDFNVKQSMFGARTGGVTGIIISLKDVASLFKYSTCQLLHAVQQHSVALFRIMWFACNLLLVADT
jgi:hypothetical protein